MINISLSQVFSNSQGKADGYMQEALRRGKVIENYLQISENDYEYLSNNFVLGSSNGKSEAAEQVLEPVKRVQIIENKIK